MTDPHTTSPAPREAAGASPGHVSVVIVGAGFAGLGTAIRLLREGHRDLLLLERADEVGGTWRDNAYPGCACDVPSRLYSFSFAPNPAWSRRFAPQEEIDRYLKHCVGRYGLAPHLRLGCELRRATWDAERLRWELDTSAGPLSAGLLVMAQGPLSEPAVPALPGLAGFTGEAFHSAGWRHDLDLSAKRVGVIGTGASAVQFVPHLQRTARQVTVFQRTPSWIAPRRDRPVPAWQHRLFQLSPTAQRLARGWEYLAREATLPALLGNRAMSELGRREALAHLHRQVEDPELRSKLTPDYALGCKRVLLSDDYYPALVQPNVRVVTDPIASIGPDTVLTTPRGGTPAASAGTASAGTAHPVDVLVFGTGFRVTDASYAKHVIGSDGRSLDEVWQGSPQAHLGTTVAGFPNLFLMAGPNTGVGHTSLIHMIESQINYLLSTLRLMRSRGLGSVDVRAEAQHAYNAELEERMAPTVWAAGGCSGWYQDRTGRVTTIWPASTWRFRRRTRAIDPDEYVLTAPRVAPDRSGSDGPVRAGAGEAQPGS
ncbi:MULTISPECIES: flavin-containing monooxygenase [Streptomycetaceae]|uniref:flavin-containing monooxygenase n=1 Tax=Streptomycetaceae TaxID=2062 RepID=UPI00093BF68D|nr:NAD(P)/FAD-dependent oxidoreductase [Streptomyces sp. CB02056]OKI06850.1 4-hydroxyacetophenone monooxygenase [Streptomyces sp. CB02056]